jgi:hypothetical protein
LSLALDGVDKTLEQVKQAIAQGEQV